MRIIIRDNEGLGLAFMNESYTKEQTNQAKEIIKTHFRDTAIQVFEKILGQSLPETIIVNMSINDREEVMGNRLATLASFKVELSREDSLYFNIYEITVKTVLDTGVTTQLMSTVIHEMFHAADLQKLKSDNQLFKTIYRDIQNKEERILNQQEIRINIALLSTLQMFNHYRAEGIAILGELLLMNSQIDNNYNPTEVFCKVFVMTMVIAINRKDGDNDMDDIEAIIYSTAYEVAPFILLLVIEKNGSIANDLSIKAFEGLTKGNNLTDDEKITIMRSALALGLSDFIQGLISLGDVVAPIRPFLEFCAEVQCDSNEEYAEAFCQLLSQPHSEKNFNAAMDRIMGCCMPVEELVDNYNVFMDTETNDTFVSPQIKERVLFLHSIVMSNDEEPNRKSLAQWALTYFYDAQDVIYDNVPELGFVDDMIVIDYAYRLLTRRQN